MSKHPCQIESTLLQYILSIKNDIRATGNESISGEIVLPLCYSQIHFGLCDMCAVIEARLGLASLQCAERRESETGVNVSPEVYEHILTVGQGVIASAPTFGGGYLLTGCTLAVMGRYVPSDHGCLQFL